MLTLIAVLITLVPVVALALFAWASRRQADLRARQIALTDALHERLGAVVAPLVRRGRRGWQVHIALPFEHRATMDAVLAIVREVFAPRVGAAGALKIILTRPVAPDPTGERSHNKELSSRR